MPNIKNCSHHESALTANELVKVYVLQTLDYQLRLVPKTELQELFFTFLFILRIVIYGHYFLLGAALRKMTYFSMHEVSSQLQFSEEEEKINRKLYRS